MQPIMRNPVSPALLWGLGLGAAAITIGGVALAARSSAAAAKRRAKARSEDCGEGALWDPSVGRCVVIDPPDEEEPPEDPEEPEEPEELEPGTHPVYVGERYALVVPVAAASWRHRLITADAEFSDLWIVLKDQQDPYTIYVDVLGTKGKGAQIHEVAAISAAGEPPLATYRLMVLNPYWTG